MNPSISILHFSDIHVHNQLREISMPQWFNKRLIGAINLMSWRAKHFDNVQEKMQALIRFKEENNIDIVINTGDYTALGLENEIKLAKKIVSPLMKQPEKYITVPGNHDYYVSNKKSKSVFFQYFSNVLHSDMPEYCTDDTWPLVRLVEDKIAVIMLNSSRANIFPWQSSGKISEGQLKSLSMILQDKRLDNRFVFLATHYAPRLKDGKDDTKFHKLVNADDFLRICKNMKSGVILCGHIHKGYKVRIDEFKSTIYCSGSATMKGHEGFWVYEVQGNEMKARRVVWKNQSYVFFE